MNFLSSLGIDTNLLIAQIINFVLLLWILSKLIYKPIVKKIEKDEEDLQQVKTKSELLEEVKKAFILQKTTELADTNKKARDIINEAEIIAENSKKQTNERLEKEVSQIIERTKSSLESQKPMLKKEILENIKSKINNNFQESFDNYFNIKWQKDIQDVLFQNLVGQIKAVTLPKIKEADIISALEKNGKYKKSNYKKQFEEIIKEKTGPIILECALAITSGPKKEIEKIISEKIGAEVTVDLKKNKDIINGFRFEVMGIIIESNLSNVIKNATNIEK